MKYASAVDYTLSYKTDVIYCLYLRLLFTLLI